MKRIALALAISIPILPIQLAEARSVQDDYQEAWAGRLARYQAEADTGKSAVEAANAKLGTLAENDPATSQTVTALFDGVEQWGFAVGRKTALGELQKFMATKPSSQRAELWMQDQSDMIRQFADKTGADAKAIGAMKIGEGGVTVESAFIAYREFRYRLGATRGLLSELELVDKNIASFFQAKSEQDERRRAKRAAFFGAIGEALQENERNNAAMLGGSSPWMATCSQWGNRTECRGN